MFKASRGSKKNKLIDRYAGIFILLILRFIKFKRGLPTEVNSCAIIVQPAIGDVLLLQGLFRELKTNGIKLQVITDRLTSEAIKLIGFVDEIIEIKFYNPLKTIPILRRVKADIVLDATQWSRIGAIYSFFVNAKYSVGFKTENQHKHLIFDKVIDHSDKQHESDNFIMLNFFSPHHPKKLLIERNVKRKDKLAVLHLKPGGYLSYLKELPLDYWKIIIDHLISKNYKLVFTGSIADKQSIDNFVKTYNITNIENMAGALSLSETADVLASSSLVISVDTGIMHLASLLQCNLISLHGPSPILRWGPSNKNSIAIKSNYSAAPCLNLGFEYKCDDRDGKCMRAIDIKEILISIDKFAS